MVFRRRRRTTKKHASVRKAVIRELAKRVEVKRKVTTMNDVSVNTGGLVTQIWPDDPQPGTGRDQRVGHEVFSLSHYVKILLSSGGDGGNTARYMVVRLRNQYAGNIRDLFENTSWVAFGNLYANFEYALVEKVYVDKLLVLNPTVEGNPMQKFRKHYLKIQEKVEWNSSLGTSQNNLYVIVVGSSGVGSFYPVKCSLLIESRYTDS